MNNSDSTIKSLNDIFTYGRWWLPLCKEWPITVCLLIIECGSGLRIGTPAHLNQCCLKTWSDLIGCTCAKCVWSRGHRFTIMEKTQSQYMYMFLPANILSCSSYHGLTPFHNQAILQQQFIQTCLCSVKYVVQWAQVHILTDHDEMGRLAVSC